MLIKLSAILIILILIFCGNKGAKSIASTMINVAVLIAYIYLIYIGQNPMLVTVTVSIIFTYVILFYQNESGEKSFIALISVVAVILIIIPLIYFLTSKMSCQGISEFQYDITDSNGYSRNIGINMLAIQNSVLVIALIGAMCDNAIAVAASIFEIKDKTGNIEKKELIKSANEVSKYIMSTSIHTVFYIYMAEFITLIMQFMKNMSAVEMLNSSSFALGILTIVVSGIGCSLVIPIATGISIMCIEKTIRFPSR